MPLCSYILCLILSIQVRLYKAQLSSRETLQNVTTCDRAYPVDITCGGDEIIAFESLRYFFDFRCNSICCTYNATDAAVNGSAIDTGNIRRECSGNSSCSITLPSTHNFAGSAGSQHNSYIVLQYYCIPINRVMPICTSGTLSSEGLPLYLTNTGYPSNTGGTESCSCSLEVYSCSLDVNLSIVDVDLYNDPTFCTQRLEFTDGSNTTLKNITCESYYDSHIETHSLKSHYLTVNFHNSANQNREGLFFIGFEASDLATHFNLSCPSNHETWCTSYHTATPVVTCQEDGTWDSASCLLIDCGSPHSIDNGTIALQVADTSTHGAMANVTCNTGYHTATHVVTCQEDGTWDSAACLLIDCGSPHSIDNGTIALQVADTSTPGAMANVTCDTGYHTASPVVTCQEDGTWDSASCLLIDCGSPHSIDNGTIALQVADTSTPGAMANVTCDTGYHTATHVVTCQEDGTWDSASCLLIDCGSPHSIDSGAIALQVADTSTPGAMAKVTCDTGYHTATLVVTCQEDGTWDSASCLLIDCGSPHSIDSGAIALQVADTSTPGAMAKVTCDTGYHTATLVVTCQEDGTWDSASCLLIDCGSPHSIDSGAIALQVADTSTPGAMAKVTCDTGYHTATLVVTCQEDGTWDSASCLLIDCGSPHSIDNGIIALQVADTSTPDAMANVTCDTGYHTATLVVTCQEDGTWDSASCLLIDCGSPHSIDNGTIALQVADTSTPGAMANVTCDTGYHTATHVVTCQEDGTWDSASCLLIDCGSPHSIDSGAIALQVADTSTPGAMAKVTCDTGYHTATLVVTCQEDGTWDSASCLLIDCGSPHSIDSGAIALQVADTSTPGAMAKVTCDTGYHTATLVVTCQEDGTWDSASCLLIDCGSPHSIDSGAIALQVADTSTPGAMAKVTCDTGYHTATLVVTCQEDGTWDSASCLLIDCGSPHSIDNGIIALQVADTSTPDAMANVTCDTGYHTATLVVTCQEDGTWDSASCLLIDCGSPHSIDNGIIALQVADTSTPGAMANVTCDTGYHTATLVVTCQEDGTWDSASCLLIDCGNPHSIDNGTIALQVADTSTPGAMANVTCDTGYHTATPVVTCQEDGTWDSASCLLIDCGSPHSIDNGTIARQVADTSTPGAMANVTCDTGYHTATPVVTCQEDGTWDSAACLLIEDTSTPGAIENVTCDTGYQDDGTWESASCVMKYHGNIVLDVADKITYGAIANVSCDTGYSASTDVLMCLVNGKWDSAYCSIIGETDDTLLILGLVGGLVLIVFAMVVITVVVGQRLNGTYYLKRKSAVQSKQA